MEGVGARTRGDGGAAPRLSWRPATVDFLTEASGGCGRRGSAACARRVRGVCAWLLQRRRDAIGLCIVTANATVASSWALPHAAWRPREHLPSDHKRITMLHTSPALSRDRTRRCTAALRDAAPLASAGVRRRAELELPRVRELPRGSHHTHPCPLSHWMAADIALVSCYFAS